MTSQPMTAVERVKAALQKANMLYGPGRPMADGYATKLAEYALAALTPASEEVAKVAGALCTLSVVYGHLAAPLQEAAGLLRRLEAERQTAVNTAKINLSVAKDRGEQIATLTAELATLRAQAGELAETMWQLLDDMGRDGNCACTYAKAKARIAYEPFKDCAVEYADWLSFERAKQIVECVDRGEPVPPDERARSASGQKE